MPLNSELYTVLSRRERLHRKALSLNLTVREFDYIMKKEVHGQDNKIKQNRAHIWQIAFFSLNNTSTNLFLAMMGYVSYYANGIAGIGVVVISFILTGMRVFDGITDPVLGYILDKTNG